MCHPGIPAVQDDSKTVPASALDGDRGGEPLFALRDVEPVAEVDQMKEGDGDGLSSALEDPFSVDQRDALSHVGGHVVEEVTEVARLVLDGTRDLLDGGERQRVAGLQQLPTGSCQPGRVFDVEHEDAESLREGSAARADRVAGQRDPGEASVSDASNQGVGLPGRGRSWRGEHCKSVGDGLW